MAATTSVVLYDPHETSTEVRTVAGFLAGYSGRTREAYTLDVRQFYRWCDDHRLGLFDVTRTHIELYARELEELGRAPATIGRRLSTIAGFYRYAAEEAVIEHSPAVHVRRPRLDYESHAIGLDRNELGAFLVAAGVSSPQDHSLCSTRPGCSARSCLAVSTPGVPDRGASEREHRASGGADRATVARAAIARCAAPFR